MKSKLKRYEKEYLSIAKKINYINEDLVMLLNRIEEDFLYNPFDSVCNNQVKELWEKISKLRNFNIY